MPPDERPSDEDKAGKRLTKAQRQYLKMMETRDWLRFGWGGYRSTQVIRALEEKGLARVRWVPVLGSTGFHWCAQITNAGLAAIKPSHLEESDDR